MPSRVRPPIGDRDPGSNQAGQFARQRRFVVHLAARHRVRKSDFARVQAETIRRIAFRTVFFVTNNWAARIREMHADLMTPPRAKLESNQRSTDFVPNHTKVCHRVARLRAAWRTANAKWVRLVEMRFKHAAIRRELSLHHSLVSLLCLFPRALQRFLCPRSFREDHQPRRFTVEPVNDPHSFLCARIACAQIFVEQIVRCSFALGLARDA